MKGQKDAPLHPPGHGHGPFARPHEWPFPASVWPAAALLQWWPLLAPPVALGGGRWTHSGRTVYGVPSTHFQLPPASVRPIHTNRGLTRTATKSCGREGGHRQQSGPRVPSPVPGMLPASTPRLPTPSPADLGEGEQAGELPTCATHLLLVGVDDQQVGVPVLAVGLGVLPGLRLVGVQVAVLPKLSPAAGAAGLRALWGEAGRVKPPRSVSGAAALRSGCGALSLALCAPGGFNRVPLANGHYATLQGQDTKYPRNSFAQSRSMEGQTGGGGSCLRILLRAQLAVQSRDQNLGSSSRTLMTRRTE